MMCESSDANARAMPAVAWMCRNVPDRRQVNAGARAGPSWIGGRRRPTQRHYAATDDMRKARQNCTHRKEHVREVFPITRPSEPKNAAKEKRPAARRARDYKTP